MTTIVLPDDTRIHRYFDGDDVYVSFPTSEMASIREALCSKSRVSLEIRGERFEAIVLSFAMAKNDDGRFDVVFRRVSGMGHT